MWCRGVGLITTLILSLLATPLATDAQQATKVHRIGLLRSGSPTSDKHLLEAFRQGLRELDYVEGQNLVIEDRYAEGRDERLPDLATELVRLQVDVIVAGGSNAIRAAQDATRTIPIVMAGTGDPVGQGFIASLAHPGGNITGLSALGAELPRQAAGTPQGNRAPERSRRRAGQSGQSKPCVQDAQLDTGSPGAGAAPARCGAAPC
jgi:ABC-type uncharacterized transport system substrate-binding protein